MARGIKDKVAILGMGCSKFGERWDSGAEELMLEAYKECLKDAGIDQNQLQAAWFSTAIDEVHVGKSGIPLSTTLRLPNIPVTHVENMCASGTEAFRGACYAVASGAADFALANVRSPRAEGVFDWQNSSPVPLPPVCWKKESPRIRLRRENPRALRQTESG